MQANSLRSSNHIENIQHADEFHGDDGSNNLASKSIFAHGNQLSPKNKKAFKRIKTSTKRNKSQRRSARKPRHNSKKNCSKSGT